MHVRILPWTKYSSYCNDVSFNSYRLMASGDEVVIAMMRADHAIGCSVRRRPATEG